MAKLNLSNYGAGIKATQNVYFDAPSEEGVRAPMGLLEKAYHGILPLHQLVLRTVNALKEEDVDLFSREGILAPELIPVLGLLTPGEQKRYRATDVFGDQGHWLPNLLLEFGTDPVTFMAAPLSILGKAHKATQLLKGTNRTGVAFRKAGLLAGKKGVSDFGTVGKLRNAIKATEMPAGMAGKYHKRRITKLLSGVKDDVKIADLVNDANKVELSIRLPFLRELTKKSASLQSHGSWWNWMNKSKASPLAWPGKAAGLAIRGFAGTTSGEKFLKTYQAGKAGLLSGVKPKLVQTGAKTAEEGDLEKWLLLAKVEEKLLKPEVIAKVRNKIESWDGVKDWGIHLGRVIPKGATKERLIELGAANSKAFLDDIEEALDLVKDMPPQSKLTEIPKEFAGNAWQKAAWSHGQTVRKSWEKKWGSGTELTSKLIREELYDIERSKALTQAYLNKAVKESELAIKELSASSGFPEGELNSLFLAWAEATPYSEDLVRLVENVRAGAVTEKQAAREVDALFNNIESSVKSIEKMLGATNPELVAKFNRIREATKLSTQVRHKWAAAQVKANVGFDTAHPMYGKYKDRWIIDLTPIEIGELQAALRVGKNGKLTKAALKQKQSIADLITAKRNLPAPLRPRTGERAETFIDGERAVLPPHSTDNFLGAWGRLEEVQRILLRASKSKTTKIDLAHLSKTLDQAGAEMRNVMNTVFKDIFGDSKHWEKIQGLHSEAVAVAHMSGGLGFGAPLTYLPRMTEKRVVNIIKKALGKSDNPVPKDGRDASLFHRSEKTRDLSLEELNTFLDTTYFKRLPKELQAGVKKQLKKEGLTTSAILKEDFMDITLSRIGKDMDRAFHSSMVDNLFMDTEVAFQHGLRGGKVVGKFNVVNGKIVAKEKTLKTTAKKGEAVTERVSTEVDDVVEQLIIEFPDGTRGLLNVTEQNKLGKVFNLGAPRATSLGDAFTLTAWNNSAQQAVRSTKSFKIGDYVASGDSTTLDWMRAAVAPQPEQMMAWLEAYDAVNWFTKRFQTVLRPGHLILNRLSGLGQSWLAGASTKSIIFAELDIQRLLGRIPGKTPEHLEKLLALARENAGVSGQLKTNILGHKFMLALADASSGTSLKVLRERHSDVVGTIARTGDEDIDLLDAIKYCVDGGLISGKFVQQELKLGGESLSALIRKSKGGDKTIRGKLEDLSDIASGSETAARLQTFIALTYEGFDMKTALSRARGTHVDYSMLTPWERNVAKRLIPFYTFSRRFTPWGIERMKAAGPGIPVQTAVKLMSSDVAGDLVYQDKWGQTRMKMPFETSIRIPRVLPQAEALTIILGAAQFLDPWNKDKIRAEIPQLDIGGGGGAGIVKDALFSRKGPSVRQAVRSVTRSLYPVQVLGKELLGDYPEGEDMMDAFFRSAISAGTGLSLDRSASLKAMAGEIRGSSTLSTQSKAELLGALEREAELESKTRR